jgi:two-component system response regulator AtoC
MLRPKILIVDDDSNVRSAFHRWFSCRGFDADEAEDGFEAVEKCTRGAYDVITLDLEMPRMTGVQALPLIRKSQPDVPIVVLTGYANETGSPALNDVNRVLLKPMSLRELETVVRDLLPADK